ncbi:MAG: hypothetical protein M0P71_12255 [Melioribacteraceae bacterium]|jgi:hypothetical protein|nr:hypothetical protein [Melioribacteraceae bacterium]
MAFRTRNLNQIATLWENPVPDGVGWHTFDDPVLVDVRWEDKQKEFIDANGETKLSNSVVYIGQDVAVNSFLALGDYTDSIYDNPADVDSAFKVSLFTKIPNVRGSTFLATCYLSKARD